MTVNFNPAGLPPGSYSATIQTTASNGLNTSTTAIASILPPSLTVTPKTIQLTAAKGASTTASFNVNMTGIFQVFIEPAPSAPWLSASVPTILPQNSPYSTNVILTANAANLSPGVQPTAKVNIRTSLSSIQPQQIDVNLTVLAGDDLTVDPLQLNFTAVAGTPTSTPASSTVSVTNTGSAIGRYTVEPSASWIVLSKTASPLGVNGVDTFSVSANAAALPAGVANGSITVSATGRPTRTIAVQFNVTPPTRDNLTVSPLSLSFTANSGSSTTTPPGPQTIQVANTGTAVSYSITSSATWLQLSKTAGNLPTDGTDSFTITALSASLPPGPQNATVRVSATGRPDQVISVTIQIQAPSQTNLTAAPTSLTFSAVPGASSTVPESATVTLSNTGPQVAYQLDTTVPWLQFSKFSGTLPADGSDQFQVVARATNLGAGAFSANITVSALGRPTQIVAVTFNVQSQQSGVTVFPPQLTFITDPGVTPLPQTLFLGSSAGTRQLSISQSSTSNWLQPASSSATAPGSLTVRVATPQVQTPASGEIQIVPADSSVASLSVPATLIQTGPAVYSIPQVADGNFFTTAITIVNRDTTPANVTLVFRRANSSNGTDPWTPLLENNAPLTTTIAPGGLFTWRTLGLSQQGDAGWVKVLCVQKISGFAIYRQKTPGRSAQEAAVPLNSGWQQRFLLPFDNTVPYLTAMAIVNISDTDSALVRAVFRDDAGALLSPTYERTLPTQGHRAFALSGEVPELAGKRGSAEFVTTGGRMSAVGLRFNDPAFTSYEPQPLHLPLNGRLTIPQVAHGTLDATTYNTTITVVNDDAVTARVSLRFRRRLASSTATDLWTPAMENNAPLDNVDIQPGSSFTWRTAGPGELTQGWAEVLSNQKVSGFAIFRQRVPGRADQEAAVPINAGTPLTFFLPFDNTGDFVTTMALANISPTANGAINVVYTNENGLVLANTSVSLSPNGHTAFALTDVPAIRGQRGVGRFTITNGDFSALGLRFTGDALTSFRPQVQ